jgi:hypothetical protein
LKLKHIKYYESCFDVNNFHKICRKPQFNQIITAVFAAEGLSFKVETDFDDFFNFIDRSIVFDDFNFVLSI